MATASNRRKWYHAFTHPGFQLQLALVNLFFLLAVVFISFFVLLSTFYYDVKTAESLWIQYASAEVMLRLFERGCLMLVVLLVVSVSYLIVFTHRFCGPLVNMKHTFEALEKGDVTRNVCLRRHDFLKAEANTINQMLAAIRNRIVSLQNAQSEIAELARQLPHGPVENRLMACLDDHQKLLDQWVVSPMSTEDNVPSASSIHLSSQSNR